MSDTKILQSILDGQSVIRKDIKRVETKVDSEFKEVKKRLDNIGLSVATLRMILPQLKTLKN